MALLVSDSGLHVSEKQWGVLLETLGNRCFSVVFRNRGETVPYEEYGRTTRVIPTVRVQTKSKTSQTVRG